MGYFVIKPEDVVCILNCNDCPHLFNFIVCSPENSFYYLDVYESHWAAKRADEAALAKREAMIMAPLKTFFDTVDISTRPKRRQAVTLIVNMVGWIHSAEYEYMERIPLNLQDSDAYAAAEESLDMLTDAINTLSEAY
jgi:hypothetical protein